MAEKALVEREVTAALAEHQLYCHSSAMPLTAILGDGA